MLRQWMLAAALLTSGVNAFAFEMIDAPMIRRGRGFVVGGQAEQATQPKAGFRVPGESAQASDTVASFTEFVENKEWEKAFRVLESLEATRPAPMIRREDGFVVPCDIQVRQMLLALPAEGKKAFRVFYDDKAKALLNPPNAGEPETSADNVANLREVYQRYLISSVGPAAADALGDAYFERGEFTRAARCWRDVIAYCADADISLARLSVKQAVALARDGDWSRFDELAARVKTRDGDATVTIGGRQVVVAAFLDELRKSAGIAEPARIDGGAPKPPAVTLPAEDRPIWRYEYFGEDRRTQTTAALRNSGFVAGAASLMGSATADEKTAYLSWMGLTMALDAATGKPRWQSARFEDMAPRLRQMASYGMLRAPAMLRLNNRLIVTSVDPNRMPYVSLASYALDNGRVEWNTANDGGLASYIFVGNFVVDNGTIYATAVGSDRSELFLFAIDPNTGTKKWEVMIGTPSANPRGGAAYDIEPRLAVGDGALAVMTNDGALAMVDLTERRIRWSFTYGSGRPLSMHRGMATSLGRGVDVAIDRGVVYFKDRMGAEVFAVQVDDASLRWKRETSSGEVISAFRDGNLYLKGETLTAYSSRGFENLWSSSHFGENSAAPFVGDARVYISGSRGMFEIDKITGKVVAMLADFEKGAPAGSMFVAGDVIYVLSDSTLAAYRARRAP